MTEEQVRELLKRHGWTFSYQTRWGQGKRFIYGKKRVSGKTRSRYIIAESKLTTMTEERIVAKLTL